MSSGNFQVTNKRALALNEKTIAATYTARVGTSSDKFVIDNPILITDPAADVTLTVPVGTQVGQTLFILLTSNSSSKTITIDAATGDDHTLDTAGDFAYYIWAGTTSGWQYITGEVAS